MAKKVTLITGCSSGIGLAIAARLARDEAKRYTVIPTMRNLSKRDDLDAAVGKPVDIRELDCLKESSMMKCVKDVMEEHGRIDVFINNAGVASLCPVEDMPMKEIRRVMETNFFAPTRLIQEILPHMLRRRSGQILSINSLTGILGCPFYEVYGASKASLDLLIEALSCRCRQMNVTVASIQAGPVTSHINDTIYLPDFDKLREGTKVEQLRNIMSYGEKVFRKYIQSAESIAEIVQNVLEENSREVRHQTSQFTKDKASMKLGDLGGLKWMNECEMILSKRHDDESK